MLPFRMVTLRHYIIEALLNIIENKKQNIAFLIFLLLSFIGIIITDSLIYSVSLKAEEELKVHNDKVVSVKIHQVRIPEDIIKRFSIISDNISFSKHTFLYVGDTPFSGKPLSVIGIDKTGLEI
ncbi:TPA: permease, partial [Escherichia coli]|nr:permease [Escherichia coli]